MHINQYNLVLYQY